MAHSRQTVLTRQEHICILISDNCAGISIIVKVVISSTTINIQPGSSRHTPAELFVRKTRWMTKTLSSCLEIAHPFLFLYSKVQNQTLSSGLSTFQTVWCFQYFYGCLKQLLASHSDKCTLIWNVVQLSSNLILHFLSAQKQIFF